MNHPLLSALFQRKTLFFGCLIFLLVVAGAALFFRQPSGVRPAIGGLELNTPALALEALSAKSLYFNGAARPWLLSNRPDLLTAEDREDLSERTRSLAQAVQSGPLFRKLDRRYRFDTLLVVGDPSQSRTLLEHLMETRDWTLVYLDHTSLVFKRDAARAWAPEDLKAVEAKFADRKAEHARFLALAATKMLAMRMPQPAKTLLDQAEALDARAIEVWNGLAIYRTNRGEWAQALSNVNRALALDANDLQALAAKTQILYSTKRFDEALNLCTRLLEARPEDPNLLYYQAKIAHERHAYGEEVVALKKLIALAEAGSRPTAGYRIYLGQAYASKSDAEPAIEQFTLALADPTLSKEQRAFADDLLSQIRKRAPQR